MTGGKSGYKGYSYQTLIFLKELLIEDSLEGILEEGDDFLIIKSDYAECYQAKDYEKPIGSTEIKKFLPNFFTYSRSNINSRFVIISPYGIVRGCNFEELCNDLLSSKKINCNKQEIDKLVKNITIKKVSEGQLKSDLSNAVADIIKSSGGNILTKEAWEIVLKLLGDIIIKLKITKRQEMVDAILKEGSPFISGVPKDCWKNSSDLVMKYSEGKFDKQQADMAVSFMANFYLKRKRLVINPSLSEKISLLYLNAENLIKNNISTYLTETEFKDLILFILKTNK